MGNGSSINVSHHQCHRHHHHCWEVTLQGVSVILVTTFVLDSPFEGVYILEERDSVSWQGVGKICFLNRLMKIPAPSRSEFGEVC